MIIERLLEYPLLEQENTKMDFKNFERKKYTRLATLYLLGCRDIFI